MYVFFISLLLFISLCVASLLITYVFTVLSNQSGRHPEPTINNVIMVQFTLLLTTLIDTVGDMISQTSQTCFGFISNIFKNSKQLLQLLVLALLLLEVSNNTDIVLRTGDTSWRCVIQPLFQNVILSVGQILRVIYDFFIPLYNYNFVVTSQATRGSIAIAIKCDFSNVLITIQLIVEVFISSFRSLFTWTGVGDMSVENNIFMNELPVTEVMDNLQGVLSHQQNITECVCEGLKDVIDIGFTVVRQKELPIAINHAVNVPVSMVQTVFQLLPLFGPKFPSLTKTLYHWNGAFYNLMKYFDRVLEEGLKKSIQLFVDDFEFQGVPEEFIFTTLARGIMSGTHTIHTIYRTLMHIMLPIPFYIMNTDYMMKAMRFDQAAEQFDLFMLNMANNGFWFLEIADSFTKAIAKSVITGGDVKIVGIPDHVRLTCEPSDKWTVATACVPYLSLTIASNFFYIVTNLVGELLWKSIFTQEQNVFRTLQRYDGPSYPRSDFISCEYRKSNVWDMTTNSSKCKCDIPVGYRPAEFTEEYPFGVPDYNPFCDQPNMNANVFANYDRIIKLTRRGSSIPDLAMEAASTYGLLNLELVRIFIKTMLNLPDILSFNFFYNKVNCGYGVSEKRLEEWWIGKGYSITDCYPPKAGYFLVDGYRCEPIHDTIRFNMCNSQSNLENTKPLCTGENKEGCQCNIGLPLNETSLCSCIYSFPDTQQEMNQTAFTNDVLQKTYASSKHWCNTYHFEYLFHELSQIGFVMDRFFSKLHPAYDSNENSYCEDMSYELASTSILSYNEDRFNQERVLFDALAMSYSTKSCKIYGSHDFICSTSMTVRRALNLIIYEVRELIMTLFELLGGSVKGVTVNLGNRLCDLQRTAAGLSSTISSIFPVGLVSNGVRIGFAKIIFVQLDLPIEILNALNHCIQFIENMLRGTAGFSRSLTQPVFNFVIDFINIWVNWIELLLDGFEDLFEGVHRGSGALFRTFKVILNIYRQFLNDAAIEMISLVIKVFGGILEMFTGGVVYKDFFNDLWNLITKMIDMLLKKSGKALEALLKLLGPVGQFIREITGEICVGLQDTLCTLSAGEFCDLGCPGTGPSSPADLGDVGSDIVEAGGEFFDSIFNRRLHSSLHTLPKILHDELEWNGVSECDMAVHAYKDYNFTDLRPMERIKLLQCVEQRALAVNIGKQLDLDLPHDLIYNWKRKYTILYEVLNSGIIYLQYSTNNLNITDMLQEMKHKNIDTDLYIPFWNKVYFNIRQMTLISHLDRFVHTLFHAFDNNIKTSDTGWGNVYRIYNHSSTAVKAIYKHTKTRDLHYDFAQAGKALQKTNLTWPSFPQHFTTTNIKRVTLRSSTTTALHKLKSRHFILRGAGLNTDVTPCQEQSNTNMCVNCLVLDNLFNTIINEGKRMGLFYKYTFVPVVLPSFIEYFNDEEKEARARAWRDDVGAMMEKAAKESAKDFSDFSTETSRWAQEKLQKNIEASQRGYKLAGRHKLYSNHTKPLTVWQRAVKDWETLILELKWRNDVRLIKAVEQFLSVTDDAYVPFFAHSASWYITYPFAGDCPMDIIYGTYPGHDTTNKRLDLMEDSFGYMLYFVIGLYLFEWITTLPFFTLLSPYILYIFAFIFLLTTYGWTWPCFPNVPNMLFDDIFALANDRIFPNCWCQYWPGLANTCNLDNCYLCSVQTTYKSCPDNIPELKELGIFWAPLTWLKVNFPEILVYLYDNPPFLWIFRRLDNLDSMFQNAIYKTPLTDIEADCFRLHIGDLVVFVLVSYVGSKALQFGVPIVIRAIQHGLKIITMLIGLFYTMAVSIELSTVTGIDKNTYQSDGY